MAFSWRANDDPILNAGLVVLLFFRASGSILLRNPILLRLFLSPTLDLPMAQIKVETQVLLDVSTGQSIYFYCGLPVMWLL